MKLPNAVQASVPERKITHYLLNPGHPVGESKAAFFLAFGFTVEEWAVLATALLQHARVNEVIESENTPYGVRYAIDGRLEAPNGASLNVRVAWFIDTGSDTPRFVTAHPLRKP